MIKDRLEFRRLLRKYHLFDLIGDESETIDWFRGIMLELAGWVSEKERARKILQRFREECSRHREERERFERLNRDQDNRFSNPYSGKKYRKIIPNQNQNEKADNTKTNH